MRAATAFWLGAALLSGTTLAGAIPGTQLGDGDPFPVSCTNFAGSWRSDQGEAYDVSQDACRALRIRRGEGAGFSDHAILADDVSRDESHADRRETVRHRWNSRREGHVLETHRTMVYPEKKKVTELVTLEELSDDVLSENTYRLIEAEGEAKRYETAHRLYRRAAAR